MFIPDPGCLFRIPDPDFYPSWIPDPKTATKEGGVKKISCHTFFCSHQFYKIENYLIFQMLQKKIWANFQRIIELFTQKIVTMLSKIWVWDPESVIQDPRYGIRKKTYYGSQIPGSRSATLVLTCLFESRFIMIWIPFVKTKKQ
jgi:hypothetical protein